MMCLWAIYKKKIREKIFLFASLKSMKKGVGSRVDPDPEPDQDPLVRGADPDPQHCSMDIIFFKCVRIVMALKPFGSNWAISGMFSYFNNFYR
jgi:hypothetical protein